MILINDDGFTAVPVAAVIALRYARLKLGIAKMFVQIPIKHHFDQALFELLKQTIVVEQCL